MKLFDLLVNFLARQDAYYSKRCLLEIWSQRVRQCCFHSIDYYYCCCCWNPNLLSRSWCLFYLYVEIKYYKNNQTLTLISLKRGSNFTILTLLLLLWSFLFSIKTEHILNYLLWLCLTIILQLLLYMIEYPKTTWLFDRGIYINNFDPFLIRCSNGCSFAHWYIVWVILNDIYHSWLTLGFASVEMTLLLIFLYISINNLHFKL